MNVKQSEDPALDRCRHLTMSPEMYDHLVLLVGSAAQPGETTVVIGRTDRRVFIDLHRLLKSCAGPNAFGKLKARLEAEAERATILATKNRALNREVDTLRKEVASLHEVREHLTAELRKSDALLNVVPEFVLNPKAPVE